MTKCCRDVGGSRLRIRNRLQAVEVRARNCEVDGSLPLLVIFPDLFGSHTLAHACIFSGAGDGRRISTYLY